MDEYWISPKFHECNFRNVFLKCKDSLSYVLQWATMGVEVRRRKISYFCHFRRQTIRFDFDQQFDTT